MTTNKQESIQQATERQRMIRMRAFRWGIVLRLLVVVLIVTPTCVCGSVHPISPISTPTPTPTLFYEAIDNPNISYTDFLGELEVEYPVRLGPYSSDTIVLAIYIPAYLASAHPIFIDRIPISDDMPSIIGALDRYRTSILIAETMRAELYSPGLEVESLYPSQQYVNIYEVNQPTIWAWAIRAPNVPGQQIFTLRIYLYEDISPSWVGSFAVEVVEPTSTPAPTDTPTNTPTVTPTPTATPVPTLTPTLTPTPTPLPPLTRLTNQLIDNAEIVFGAILTFMATIIGIYAQHSKTKDKIEKLEKKIDELSKEREKEREGLKKEISRLRSIKWWQFWRK